MARFVGVLVAAVIALLFGTYPPAQSSETANSSLAMTRKVYSRLLAEAGKDEASLTMFVNMLPKGGDIHHHFSGALYAETYLEWAKQNGFCIFTETSKSLGTQKFYVATEPDRLEAGKRAVCRDVDAVVAEEDFYSELLMKWSLKDFNHQSPGDKHFFDTFQYFTPIAAASYARGMQHLKARAIAENVSYIETILEQSPAVESPQVSQAFLGINANLDEAQLEKQLAQAYDALEGTPEAKTAIGSFLAIVNAASKGIDDEQFTARYVAFVLRNQPPQEIFSRLYTAFKAAEVHEELVGINVVGPENGPVAMRDYALHMKMFAFFKRKHPSVRLSLHAGELALGLVPPEGLTFHINEAVHIASAERIGHGVDIPYEAGAADLLAYMRKNRIAVEINLTSNKEILGISGASHPLHLYQKYRVPYVISTDDAGVSRNTLSSEYLLYTVGFRPSYDELKATVFRSISYSFLSDADKKRELQKLNERFLGFEKAIATSFSQFMR